IQAMAECSGPPQSTRKDVLGTFYPSPEPVDSSTPSSAPLSRRTLLRHSSFVRAVCVDAPVRICAGGDQGWSSLPQQLFRVVSPVGGESNRGHFSDSERFISTCNKLQEHGRHPKSLQDTLAHRYCVPRRVLWLLAVFVSVEELVDEWDSNP